MDELGANENCITKENFAEVASEKICRILCFPGNDSYRTSAMKFLQKAARGFALHDHEPWFKALSTTESNKVILSHCKSSVQKLDMLTPSLNAHLSFIICHPLQFNHFIASLTTLFVSQIEESKKCLCLSNEHCVEKCNAFQVQEMDDRICSYPAEHHLNANVCESHSKKKYAQNISDICPSKKMANCGGQSVNVDESIGFLKHVWSWARTGRIKLDPNILGDALYNLPECIEEVVLSWAKEALISSHGVDNKGADLEVKTVGCRSGSVQSEDVMLNSLSVLQESPIFLAAAASSPKLFQRTSSILNQLLIQASKCSLSWSSLSSLCKTFAQETAKGRAEFYPLQVQPLILLMEIDPNTLSSNEHRELISSQLTNMFSGLPTEVMVAVLSHFPAWLPFLDLAVLL